MNNWPIVAWGYRGGGMGLRFPGLVCHLPLAQRGPAFIVCAVQDGGVANRYAIRLDFIDNAVIERHGPRGGFIDTGIMKAAFVQNGDGKDVRGDDAGRVRSDLNHGCGPQLVRFTTLGERSGDGRSNTSTSTALARNLLLLYKFIDLINTEKPMEVNDKAPEFTLANEEGKPTALKDYRGKNVVLFFYPKANTPG